MLPSSFSLHNTLNQTVSEVVSNDYVKKNTEKEKKNTDISYVLSLLSSL